MSANTKGKGYYTPAFDEHKSKPLNKNGQDILDTLCVRRTNQSLIEDLSIT